ncbi:hypothetical protein NC652_027309 [Populus alba x Populus x berolinensis]|nr:hypothetical protein NC652_027309 [Populus alba x Populus x berolinensis]
MISEGFYTIEADNVITLGVLVAQRDDVLASVNLYYQRKEPCKMCQALLLLFGCFFGEENDFLYRDFWLSHAQNASDEETEPDGLGFVIERSLHICCKFVNQNALDVMSALWKLYPKRLEFQGKQLFCSLGDWKKDGRYHVEAWS